MAIELDPQTNVVNEYFAVIYAPKKSRGRFPENCVEVMESRASALEKAAPEQNQYAARVAGPSRSSEGVRLYYLVNWLD